MHIKSITPDHIFYTLFFPQVESSLMMTLHNVTARVYSSGTPSADASPTQNGASPFSPLVTPGAVSSSTSTPIDEEGTADEAGLSSAYCAVTTSFEIESRDRCDKKYVRDVNGVKTVLTCGTHIRPAYREASMFH